MILCEYTQVEAYGARKLVERQQHGYTAAHMH